MQILCLKSAISRGIFRLIFTKNSKGRSSEGFAIKRHMFMVAHTNLTF